MGICQSIRIRRKKGMGTSQSMPTDQTLNEPVQGMGTSQSMPTYQTLNEPVQVHLKDPFDYPPLSTPTNQSQSMPTDQTLNEPVQGMGTSQSMPTNQTLNEPVQVHLQDPFDHPPLSTPTNQTPSGPVQGFEHDLHVPQGMTTYQTPYGPVVGFLRDPSNPPLLLPSGRMRECTSCRRLEVQIREPEVLIKLDGQRYLCSDCLPMSLMESRQLKPFIRQVHKFFDDYLKFPVNKGIPVFFVEENQMNKYRPEIHSGQEDVPYFGGFLSTGDTINIVKRCERRGDDIVAVTKRKEIKEPAILLLFGFPKEVLGTTLAHEIVHAWIWLQGWNFRLRKEVEEGICEAVAYKWLKYIAGNYDQSYSEKDVTFIKRVMDHHKSVIKAAEIGSCGAEFWKAKRAIKKYGLEGTMKLVARTEDIPE